MGKMIIKAVIVTALLVGLGGAGAGCASGEVKTGTIWVLVTDAPPEYEMTSIMVTVSGIKVLKAGEGGPGGEGEWKTLAVTGANPFELIGLEGVESLLVMEEIAAGHYTDIHLTIDKYDVVLGATSLDIVVSDPFEFTRSFEVVSGETVILVFDFDIDKTVAVDAEGKITVKPIDNITLSIPEDGLRYIYPLP
jgi:hypothetical protein